MSDNGRNTGENDYTGAPAPVQGVPLTRRQLREREAAAQHETLAHAAPQSLSTMPPPVAPGNGVPAQIDSEPAAPPAAPSAVEGGSAIVPERPFAPQVIPAATFGAAPQSSPALSVQSSAAVFGGQSATPIAPDSAPLRRRRDSRNDPTPAVVEIPRPFGSTGPSSADFALASSTIANTPRVSKARRARETIASKLLSAGAMVFAAALLVGTTVPANAFMSVDENVAVADVAQSQVSAQTLNVSTEAVEAVSARDSFTVTSYADLLRQKYGNVSYNYSVTSGAVRWPFPFTVPISSGFGDRVAPCRSCSSQHMGLDFTPGAGSPIYAIADGVVSHSEISRWGYGNWVTIDHVINGQKVQTLYAHMQMNSSPLLVGDQIEVGDFIGLVGSTGASTGAHLHFEVRLDGVQVDPFAWLKANAVN